MKDWQSAASSLIVSIGSVYGDVVLDVIKDMFVPGAVPHYFVVKTLADFAATNGTERKHQLVLLLLKFNVIVAS